MPTVTARGIDYAWHGAGAPSVAALHRNGVDFVCRYVGAGSGNKPLTRTEADRLRAGGIHLVSAYESGAGRMSGGAGAGRADAGVAYQAALSCGMPEGRPILYAADSDTVTPAEAIAYCVAARSVTGPGTVGIYGSYYVVKLRHGARSTLELPEPVQAEHEARMAAVQAGVHSYWAAHFPDEPVITWQTRAWSSGNRYAGMNIWQGAQVTIDGVDCDADEAYTADYGQWDYPGGNDVAKLDQDDLDNIRDIVVNFGIRYKNQEMAGSADLYAVEVNSWRQVQQIAADLAAIKAAQSADAVQLTDMEAHIVAAIKAATQTGGVDPVALAAALAPHLGDDLRMALGQALVNG